MRTECIQVGKLVSETMLEARNFRFKENNEPKSLDSNLGEKQKTQNGYKYRSFRNFQLEYLRTHKWHLNSTGITCLWHFPGERLLTLKFGVRRTGYTVAWTSVLVHRRINNKYFLGTMLAAISEGDAGPS
jgi:hypothetical protein